MLGEKPLKSIHQRNPWNSMKLVIDSKSNSKNNKLQLIRGLSIQAFPTQMVKLVHLLEVMKRIKLNLWVWLIKSQFNHLTWNWLLSKTSQRRNKRPNVNNLKTLKSKSLTITNKWAWVRSTGQKCFKKSLMTNLRKENSKWTNWKQKKRKNINKLWNLELKSKKRSKEVL